LSKENYELANANSRALKWWSWNKHQTGTLR